MKFKSMKVVIASLALSASVFANAGLISVTGLGAQIPDNDAVGFTSIVNVVDDVIIDDISITVSGLQSTWIGDLIIRLVGPSFSADLMHRVGTANGRDIGDASDMNGDYIFADSGLDLWAAARAAARALGREGVVGAGTYSATSLAGATVSLSDIYSGAMSAGDWSLVVSDNVGGDLNQFDAWTLNITYSDVTSVPVPSTLAIFALGVIGLASRRLKK
jgi:subtilisin-like proprotein convertase family protein